MDIMKIIYVDDMVFTGDDIVEMGKLQKYLASEFETKDLGALKCALAETLIVHNHYLAIYPDQVPTNKERYHSQFMLSPTEDHLAVVMRILSYLKKALGRCLIFRKPGHLDAKGYKDADWAGNITDRCST
ncbi:unnamed protein product [Prunus armeniaca]